MGTIPGPVIECDLSERDTVVVHFRNADRRADKGVRARVHSLHPTTSPLTSSMTAPIRSRHRTVASRSALRPLRGRRSG